MTKRHYQSDIHGRNSYWILKMVRTSSQVEADNSGFNNHAPPILEPCSITSYSISTILAHPSIERSSEISTSSSFDVLLGDAHVVDTTELGVCRAVS